MLIPCLASLYHVFYLFTYRIDPSVSWSILAIVAWLRSKSLFSIPLLVYISKFPRLFHEIPVSMRLFGALAVMGSQLTQLPRCRRLIFLFIVSVFCFSIMVLVVGGFGAPGVVFVLCLFALTIFVTVAQVVVGGGRGLAEEIWLLLPLPLFPLWIGWLVVVAWG